MSRVYIPNKGAHDYESAKRFGELVFCTDGVLDKWDTSQMYRELSTAMRESHAEDFIVLTSLASLCSIAAAIFAAKHGRLNLLIHRADGYVARTLMLDNESTVKNGKRSSRSNS
ncbi:MAG: hypothetical protein ACYDB1_00690 [Acidiferrobacteraceae bacterium]